MTPFPSSHQSGIQKKGTVPDGEPQVDWNVTDDGRGVLTGTMRFFYDYRTGRSADGVSVPARGERHPFDERLVCKDVQTSYGSNDIAYCDANYVGLKQDPSVPEWSLSCPTEEDPIETHPMFQTPKGKEGSFGVIEEVGDASTQYYPKWNDQMAETTGKVNKEFKAFKVSKETIEKDLVGVESYKVTRPTMSMTIHTANKELLFAAIKNTGKQYLSIPFGPEWADVSKINRSWLFTSLSVTEYAGIYKMDMEFTLSGIGPDNKGKTWNKLIYPFA